MVRLGQVKLGYSNSILFQEQYTNFYSVFTHHIQFSTLFLTTEKLQKKQYTNFTPDLTSIYKFTPCFDPQKIMKINEILYTIFTTVLNFQYTNGSAVLVVKSIHWIIQNYTHSLVKNCLLNEWILVLMHKGPDFLVLSYVALLDMDFLFEICFLSARLASASASKDLNCPSPCLKSKS